MHLGLIPVDNGFQGHRFCEENHTLKDQWSSGDVWLWNLQFSNDGGDQLGQFLVDANGTSYQGQAPGDTEENYANFAPWSPSSGSGSGWMSRPFHPKKAGFQLMKDTFIQRLKNDHVPGVKLDAASIPPHSATATSALLVAKSADQGLPINRLGVL
jgi:hypothetical protein